MATIYRRKRRKPIPDGADTITRKGQRFAVWTDAKTGRKHKAPLSDDGAAILLELSGYTIQWFDHNGRRRKKAVRCGDLDTARQIAADLERKAAKRREGLIDATQERFAQEGRRPPGEHLADFARFLADKANTPKHVTMTRQHIGWAVER
jgi:hypothetical protein